MTSGPAFQPVGGSGYLPAFKREDSIEIFAIEMMQELFLAFVQKEKSGVIRYCITVSEIAECVAPIYLLQGYFFNIHNRYLTTSP